MSRDSDASPRARSRAAPSHGLSHARHRLALILALGSLGLGCKSQEPDAPAAVSNEPDAVLAGKGRGPGVRFVDGDAGAAPPRGGGPPPSRITPP
ncbi:MAG: hypothetical protein ACRELB_00405 [Polyangiaceae bacterium]